MLKCEGTYLYHISIHAPDFSSTQENMLVKISEESSSPEIVHIYYICMHFLLSLKLIYFLYYQAIKNHI